MSDRLLAGAGALMRRILSGVESLYVWPMVLLNFGSGLGRTSCADTEVAAIAAYTPISMTVKMISLASRLILFLLTFEMSIVM